MLLDTFCTCNFIVWLIKLKTVEMSVFSVIFIVLSVWQLFNDGAILFQNYLFPFHNSLNTTVQAIALGEIWVNFEKFDFHTLKLK